MEHAFLYGTPIYVNFAKSIAGKTRSVSTLNRAPNAYVLKEKLNVLENALTQILILKTADTAEIHAMKIMFAIMELAPRDVAKI